MTSQGFMATAWNNGEHHPSGAGYGLKISARDRDAYFKREWKTVELRLAGTNGAVKVNIDKDSFWTETCRELISKDIGLWLMRNRLAPWQKGAPPKFRMVARGVGVFDVVSP